jgi:hypothetical protein
VLDPRRGSLRVEEIDLFKGLHMLYMVTAHTVHFVFFKEQALGGNLAAYHFQWTLGPIIVFSAFLFVFGYACYRAYLLPGRTRVRPRALRTALRIYFAYLLCGGLWIAITQAGEPHLRPYLVDLALGRAPKPYSDFLLPYSAMALLICLAPAFWRWVVHTPGAWMALFVLSVASTFFPAPEGTPGEVAVLWPVAGAPHIPLVPYLQIWLAGALCSTASSLPVRRCLLIGSAVTGFAVLGVWWTDSLRRFPPAPWFVWMSALPIALLLAFSWWLQRRVALGGLTARLRDVGRNPLVYVILSNLILFSIGGVKAFKTTRYAHAILYGLGVFAIVRILHRIFLLRAGK